MVSSIYQVITSRPIDVTLCDLLSGEEEDDLEENQQQGLQYESMQISAILQPYPREEDADTSSAEPGQHLL